MREHEDPYNELFAEILHRIEALEQRVERLPCDHIGFPLDEGYELDEDDFEVRVEYCRNCGEIV
jgi:hypothetical protein